MNTQQRHSFARFLFWLFVAGIIIALDVLTKHIASQTLELYRPVEVTSWLNWTLAHNAGAAFSLFADAAGWQRWFFIVVAVLVSAVLLFMLWRQPPGSRLLPAALTLVLGGALGNLIDRVRFGYVVDFIDVHAMDRHWPAFNVADSAIVVGVMLILIEGFLPRRKEE